MRARDLLDRVLVLLLGLAFLGGGLALVDWQEQRVLDLPARVDASLVADLSDVVARGWFRWAEGGAGVVLAVLALLWLLAHLPRRGPSTAPLAGSTADGELAVDLGALGGVVGSALDDSGALEGSRVAFRRHGGRTTATVTARLAEDADVAAVTETVAGVRADLERALPGAVHLQVRLGAPRRRRALRTGRRATVRLQ